MALGSAPSARSLLVLLLLPLVSACPGPNPPAGDTTAPITQAEPRGGSFTAPVSVTLSCGDEEGSGCSATYYTTDGSQPTRDSTRYSAPIRLTATTALKFFSVDGANNEEAVKTEQYTIATAAPTVTAVPQGGAYSSAQTVTLTCTAAAGVSCASIRYTTDGSTPTASSPLYSAPLSVATSTTLRFFAADSLGNTSTLVAETYVIDTTAPTVSASPSGGSYNATRTVTLSCNDGAGSGCTTIRYTTDGSTPTATSPTYTAPLTVSSNTTLRFFATDAAGNTSPVVAEAYVIDTAAPTVSASPAGGTYSEAQTVTLNCGDGAGSGCAAIRYTTDGSAPTASSPTYSTPLAISSDTTLRFFAIDAVGNSSAVAGVSYFIDTTPPTTTASPIGGLYPTGPVTVTLTCDDGPTGIGCDAIYYSTTGPADPFSTRYTGPLTLTRYTELSAISVDRFGRIEPFKFWTYWIGTAPASVSAQIAAVRAAADGTVNQIIEPVLVTYIKPAVGTEPAGFFIQAEQAGPALFIAVDPASLAPYTPTVGRRIRLPPTQRATMEGRVHVTAIDLNEYVPLGSIEPVESLRAEVSNVDLPTMLSNYEGELISLSGTLSGAVSAPANGFVTAPLSTTGAPSSPNLLLRLPSTLQGQLNLRSGCGVTVKSPLWRSNAQALVTAWVAGDITVHACP